MDEVDALCPDRDGREVESTSEQTRLVAILLTLLDGVGKEREGEGMGEDDDFEAEKVEEIGENVSEEEDDDEDEGEGGKSGGDTGAASSVMPPSIVAPSSILADALTEFYTRHNPAKIANVPAVVAWYVDKRDALDVVLVKEYGVSLGSEAAEAAAAEAAAAEAAARLSQLTIDDESDGEDDDADSAGHSKCVASLFGMSLLVVGATNRAHALDAALRRPGRMDREIVMHPPGTAERLEILQTILTPQQAIGAPVAKGLPLHPSLLLADADTGAANALIPRNGRCDLRKISELCVGYVGADLAALCREAAMRGVERTSSSAAGAERRGRLGDGELSPITFDDFMYAMTRVGPSSLRQHTQQQPSSSSSSSSSSSDDSSPWDVVGGLEHVKKRLQQAVEWPLKHPQHYAKLGIRPPRGVLLYGPPGCSKTTLARVAASASAAAFLAFSGADIYSPYVGQAEAMVRQAFAVARGALPAILFFDELEQIVGKRTHDDGDSGAGVQQRVLATFLNEMDGVESADGLLVLGATNRPDLIDDALLRPGRFDQLVYVPPPGGGNSVSDGSGEDASVGSNTSTEAIEAILRVHTKRMPLKLAGAADSESLSTDGDGSGSSVVDLKALARVVNPRMSGADIEGACREAALLALRESIDATEVSQEHLMRALGNAVPSISAAALASYGEAGQMRR
jgi:SpoVK/Ycf46/Vps4 family AAA+-type ATPase